MKLLEIEKANKRISENPFVEPAFLKIRSEGQVAEHSFCDLPSTQLTASGEPQQEEETAFAYEDERAKGSDQIIVDGLSKQKAKLLSDKMLGFWSDKKEIEFRRINGLIEYFSGDPELSQKMKTRYETLLTQAQDLLQSSRRQLRKFHKK